jgi:hypothetical protein
VRIRQYVYFGLLSSKTSAADITARLRMEPDKGVVRGSRTPARPVCHAWQVVCADRGLAVDEQLAQVVHRLAPRSAEIIALARELRADDPEHGGAVMRVVRYFDAEDGEEEELSPPDAPLRKLAGQHQLLGWVLDREVLEFLLAVDAVLDVDEYG